MVYGFWMIMVYGRKYGSINSYSSTMIYGRNIVDVNGIYKATHNIS